MLEFNPKSVRRGAVKAYKESLVANLHFANLYVYGKKIQNEKISRIFINSPAGLSAMAG